jgi:RNA polymerase sigma factor (sigma-70 family)
MNESWDEAPDALIVDACLAGDEKAWQVLVNRYKRLVYSIPIKWGLSPDDSTDIFQSVWMDCFRQLSSLRNMEGLQPWLTRLAIRKCHRFTVRTRARGETPVADDDMEELLIFDNVVSVFELEREQVIRSAIQKLSPRCREIIQLLFFEEPRPSYQAIAARLGLSANSIGFTRERCLAQLKKVIAELGYQP